MDAWELLLQKSSLTPPGFDAWEHLQSVNSYLNKLVLTSGLEIEIDDDPFEVEVDDSTYGIEIETEIIVGVSCL